MRGENIIAKRCVTATARHERIVYETVLEKLELGVPRFRGLAEDSDDRYCWLFLDDAGNHKYSRSSTSHAALAAHWLAELHSSTDNVSVTDIPERGAVDFIERLKCGRARLTNFAETNDLDSGTHDFFAHTIELMNALESAWNEIESRCEHMPRVLTHGDFKLSNLRILDAEAGPRLIAMDWEMAAFGPVAIDMHGFNVGDFGSVTALPPSAYLAVSRASWDRFDTHDVDSAALIGTVFRQLSSIEWESQKLHPRSIVKNLERFGVYRQRLTEALKRLELVA